MDKTVEYDDDVSVTPVKIKEKSKKNKNISDDLLHFGDGETDFDNVKKNKKDKHSEKMNLEAKEDEEIDSDHIKKKKKKKKSESKEDDEEIDSDSIKKKKNDKKKKKSESKEDGDEDQHDEGNLVNDDLQKKDKKRMRKENEPGQNIEPDVMKNDKKKKKKNKIDGENLDTENKSKKKQKVKNKSTEAKSKSKSKRVSFSGHVEVFPTSETDREKQATEKDGLLRGVRFTPEEDEKVKQAVYNYIDLKGLGDEGLDMVLNCKSHKELIGCWKEIGECIPYRPLTAVYLRAHVLFERSKHRSWTPEEYEMLKKLHEEHGNDWKKLSQMLGKHRHQVKDTWRRIKHGKLRRGRWSRDEYQNLYDLVNLDLKLKVVGEAEKHSKHGMLRDNIRWSAISEKLTTRSDALCCVKWYNSLTSSLVAEKKWSDADDYRMIGSLYEIDASCVDDVDWDSVLEHRPGEICLKRWNQMVKHIEDYASKSFCELVDILADRYCPDMAEIREEWDNKPYVI